MFTNRKYVCTLWLKKNTIYSDMFSCWVRTPFYTSICWFSTDRQRTVYLNISIIIYSNIVWLNTFSSFRSTRSLLSWYFKCKQKIKYKKYVKSVKLNLPFLHKNSSKNFRLKSFSNGLILRKTKCTIFSMSCSHGLLYNRTHGHLL